MYNLFRKIKNEKTNDVKISESTVVNEKYSIKAFENKMKSQFKILQDVNFIYDTDKADYENMTIPGTGDKKTVVTVGVKGYDFDNLTDKQRLKLYNTIVHELIHIRDREKVPIDVQEKINSGQFRRTLGHFGYMIYDEYVAYKESNEIYREEASDLKSDEDKIVNIFYNHLLKKGLVIDKTLNYRTENDKAQFYRSFLDYCSALIALYIIKGKLYGTSKNIESLNNCISILGDVFLDKGCVLSWDEYEKLADRFITGIIGDLPSSQRQTFKYNTEIIFR